MATPFWFFCITHYGNIPTETLLTGSSNAGGGMKTQFSTNISLYLRHDTR